MNQQMQDLAVTAAQGDANAQHQLGAIFLAGDTSIADHTQALNLLTKAAEQGHAEAELLLGKAYFELARAYFTRGTQERNPVKAVVLLMQAIENGYTPAYLALAQVYAIGAKGVDKCLATASKVLLDGAIRGDVKCQYKLGQSLLNQSRCMNDQQAIDGIKWLTIAGMQDHKPAQLMLAEIYQDNEYAKPDSQMALFWHSKAQILTNTDLM